MRAFVASLILLLLLPGPSPRAEDFSALERAHKHYESGVSLFEAGNKEQALVEFQLANELAPKKENIFMIAQCEYHLGQLVAARSHYEAFLAEQKQGELADLSRLRIEAINRRPGVFAINTVPDNVEVRIEGPTATVVGQAPNEFRVPRGRYHIIVSKENFTSETRELSIDVAETKPLFFKLEPIPAHLTIRTVPPNAALFVRGNRAQNPYTQDVPPGNYEIYAEASYYQPKRESITLAPGEKRVVDFPLTYVQRSGRPELIGFWTGIGALGGGLAVLTQRTPNNGTNTTLVGAGMLAGGLGLGVLSSTTPFVPDYIRDNLALFRIGASWIGDVEGATLAAGLSHNNKWTAPWFGGAAGLVGGAFVGWWLDDKSPNYGRVALIQSSALLGAVAGAFMVPALGLYPKDLPGTPPPTPAQISDHDNQVKRRLSWGILAGLNVGLATGLAMAYLPDQTVYGPSWQRVLMVDLAGIAGAIFATTIAICRPGSDNVNCANQTQGSNNNILVGRTARYALVGAGIGLVAGWLLTWNYDRNIQQSPASPLLSHLPMPGVLPVQTPSGAPELLPGLVSQGQF